MKVNITRKDLEALETGYALMEGYCLDDAEENKNWLRQANRLKRIIDQCHKEFYSK